MIILGIDPGFANLGWAVVEADAGSVTLQSAGVIRTEKTPTKRGVLVAEDDFKRAEVLAGGIADLIVQHEPVALCSEAMSFPQTHRAKVGLALCWGVMAALVHDYDLAMVQPSPQFIKKQLCGKRDASKAEVEAAVIGECNHTRDILHNVIKTKREHAVDAFAAVLASLDSDVIRLLRKVS